MTSRQFFSLLNRLVIFLIIKYYKSNIIARFYYEKSCHTLGMDIQVHLMLH